MISTKKDRLDRANRLLTVLLGLSRLRVTHGDRKRPPTLTKGTNFTPNEWHILRQVAYAYQEGRNISILHIFELEEIEKKYQEQLCLAKFEL